MQQHMTAWAAMGITEEVTVAECTCESCRMAHEPVNAGVQVARIRRGQVVCDKARANPFVILLRDAELSADPVHQFMIIKRSACNDVRDSCG